MVTTTKTTRGLIITICKYCLYQDFKNYESHNESHNEATMKPQPTAMIEKEVNTVIQKNKKRVSPTKAALPPDDDFWKQIKGLYYWVNVDMETNKMKAYQLTERGKNWKMTKRSVVNWLNKIEKPLGTGATKPKWQQVADGDI